MAITQDFMEAVSNNKKTRVRIMLKDIMLVDPSLRTFNEMLAYAEANMENLYDEHNGEDLSNNPQTYTEDYMNEQMVAVVSNFSKLRINLLKQIVQHLYSHKTSEHTQNDSRTKHTKCILTCEATEQQLVGGAVALAGTFILGVGIGISNIAIATVGGIVAVGGIVMVYTGEDKEV